MDYLKEKKELVSVALICVSAILAVSIIVKISGFFTAPARAESIVKAAIEQNTEDASNIDKYFTESKKIADELKKKNLFAPPAPKQHPVRDIEGIFGDEVIINSKLYKVGDKIADAKIISIGTTQVTIEWNGKKKTFSPMDAGGSSQPSRSRGSRQTTRRKTSEGGTAQMVTVGSEGFRGIGEKFTNKSEAKMQAKRARQDQENLRNIKERWSTMPEEVRQKLTELRERWPSMSEEEKDKIRARLSERFGSGKRGGK